jgi:hypothetical protein
VKFDWNSKKALINLKKHHVSFDEAKTVFDDPLACIFDDEWHSVEELRELIIGYSINKRFLVVSFTERIAGFIRVISARQATATERNDYENHRRIY